MPGLITEISGRLHRERSAVKRDVDELECAGLVTVSEKALPGHRRMKEVRVTALRFVGGVGGVGGPIDSVIEGGKVHWQIEVLFY